jgi:PadR family transcriptional regulator PadR
MITGFGMLRYKKEVHHSLVPFWDLFGNRLKLFNLLVLVLSQKDSYGYELMEEIQHLGATPDASAVYRMLRRMESEELVESQWVTEGTGPAKRVYKITPEGEDLLNSWVAVLNSHKESLQQFLDVYKQEIRKRG